MGESARVDAFIQARQQQVLEKALTAMQSAEPADLAGVVHRLIGTLGTYGLPEAAAALRPLDEILKSDSPGEAEVGRARLAAVSTLTAVRDASREAHS